MQRSIKALSLSVLPTAHGYIHMARFFHPLIMVLARTTDAELARDVEYLHGKVLPVHSFAEIRLPGGVSGFSIGTRASLLRQKRSSFWAMIFILMTVCRKLLAARNSFASCCATTYDATSLLAICSK